MSQVGAAVEDWAHEQEAWGCWYVQQAEERVAWATRENQYPREREKVFETQQSQQHLVQSTGSILSIISML